MNQFRPSQSNLFPPVLKNLLIVNVIFFLAQQTISKQWFDMEDVFGLHTIQSPLFKPWQLVTYMFLHGDLGHLAGNMISLWFFGSWLEQVFGSKRFFNFYFICGLSAALPHLAALFYENQAMIDASKQIFSEAQFKQFVNQYTPTYYDKNVNDVVISHLNVATLGASGAVFGCMAAFAYLFPNVVLMVNFFIPVKAKWLVLIYGAIELWLTIHNSAGDNIAHLAHLGGAVAGLIVVYLWKKQGRRYF